MTDSRWFGRTLELRLGNPGHGGFCVARHEGRVVFVRHGLPGELVRATITEDRGGSFCRADAVEIIEASADRIPALCPVAGPGGAGCCDFSHATLSAQRAIKASVVAEQLRRLAGLDMSVDVDEIAGTGNGGGWRTRVRLAVDDRGRVGTHRFRSSDVITDLRCPQPVPGAMDGLDDQEWRPGSDVQVAIDSERTRHVVELEPARVSKTGKRSPGRRGAMARRAAAGGPRAERVVDGTGKPVQRVGDREWRVGATGFWQAHRGAADAYSQVISEWAQASRDAVVWDLYSGAGVFAAQLAEQVGASGTVAAVESSGAAVADGVRALGDLPQIDMRAQRVERAIPELPARPQVVVLDPPRAGAGREVIAAVAHHGPERIVHIGCDPASFARDVSLYQSEGYRVEQIRAFDAFPLTHHVECIGLFVR
ncbi:class I SAM-dependent RNA methyltransferase [Antrihabitans cavernicola]|uniref:Class I SAM-dependent RNA methyltransferase n=1 Tax=Antrihabitans cavernicola TaxID=2495913 RepID=A0A5A7SB95_9NOCA|nr:TRAM domain-containing protein [Spelaeibacter cavernicola]KAA0023410.1 class I SAM-dependent RNA methyltransferase [Spelaeibacter cavernicola]